MEILFYVLAVIGSVSLGYSLFRIGFPEKQEITPREKIEYSYGLGLLIVLPALAFFQTLSIYGFFVIACLVYFALGVIFFILRVVQNKKDNNELYQKKEKIPSAIKQKMKKEKNTQIFKEKTTNQINTKQKNINEKALNKNQNETKEKALNELKKAAQELEVKERPKDDDELEGLVFE